MRSASWLLSMALVLVACGGGGDGRAELPEAPVAPGPETPAPGETPAAPAPQSPAGSFQLEAPSDQLVVRNSKQTTFDVSVVRSGSFAGEVALDLAEVPAGITAALTESGGGAAITLTATDSAKLGDGSVLVRGTSGGVVREARVRFVVPGVAGKLDPTFGNAGFSPTVTGAPQAMAMDAKGRTLLAAYDVQGKQALLARFGADGQPDTTFDLDGFMTSPLIPGAVDSAPTAILPLSDGSLLVAGGAFDGVTTRACLSKLDDKGALVTAFGAKGWVCADAALGTFKPRALAVGPDGSLYVGGTAVTATLDDLAVLKLTPGGTVDTTFGASGLAVHARSGQQRVKGLSVDSKGRIVVGGDCSDVKMACMWRLDAKGGVDPLLPGGLALAAVGMLETYTQAMALSPSDETFFVGGTGTSHLGVVAFGADGGPLASFGSNGWQTFALTQAETLVAAAWDDGKLLVAGVAYPTPMDARPFVARMHADGQLDGGFGTGGSEVLAVNTPCSVTRLALSPGRATALVEGSLSFRVARLWR